MTGLHEFDDATRHRSLDEDEMRVTKQGQIDSFKPLFDDLDQTVPRPGLFPSPRRIETAIESGILPAGTKLENELKLADDVKLSRPTIRRAIQELVNNGLLGADAE